MGDPGGIGAEVIVKALNDPALRKAARHVVLGLGSCLERAAEVAGIDPYWTSIAPTNRCPSDSPVVLIDSELAPGASRFGPFEPTDSGQGGELSLGWVLKAVEMAKGTSSLLPNADAIVTGPISKASWAMAGEFKHPGHTGLIAAKFGVMKYAMMFVSPVLNTILVTDHLPLKHVPRAVTSWTVRDTIELGHEACVRMGMERPRIAVCGLNPHAGEGGVLGEEDFQDIKPGIEQARAKGIDASGPYPADTVFLDAMDRPGRARKFDLVVAMYHDQGLIPFKLLAWEVGVNTTVGLPVPRTSPDHGTAFDIAGRNLADAGSMKAAIELAIRLARPG